MGIDMEDIDAEEVIIRTSDEELYFEDAEVQLMEAQGQKTYQVIGDPETRPRGSGDADAGGGGASADESASAAGIDHQDVQIVAQRAGVSQREAREALEAHEGDLAAAVADLE